MARKAKKVESESEEEFVVEALKAHKRNRKGVLEYKVKWQGYDNPKDDTWEPAEGLQNCTLAMKKYWDSKDPEERLEQFKPGSKEYKALKKQLDDENAQEEDDEEEQGEEEEDSEPASPRQKRAAARKANEKEKSKSASPGKKRSSSSRGGGEEEKSKPNKRAKKVVQEEQEEEEEAEADVEPVNGDDGDSEEDEGFEPADRQEMPWREVVDSSDPNSWEDLVDTIETCIEGKGDSAGRPVMLLIWKEKSGSGIPFASYVDSKICRSTCPQKCIDFYEIHLKFKQPVGAGSPTPGQEETTKVDSPEREEVDPKQQEEQGQEQEEGEKVTDLAARSSTVVSPAKKSPAFATGNVTKSSPTKNTSNE